MKRLKCADENEREHCILGWLISLFGFFLQKGISFFGENHLMKLIEVHIRITVNFLTLYTTFLVHILLQKCCSSNSAGCPLIEIAVCKV